MEIKNKRSEAEELNLAISLLRACLPNIEYLSGAPSKKALNLATNSINVIT